MGRWAMSELMIALGVAVGGGLGAATRYLIDLSIPDRVRARFPWGVMLINLSGSFALGLLTGAALDAPIVATISIGFLGGYTTFSTASLDTVQLLRRKRTAAALLNGIGMLVAAVALAALGIAWGSSL